MLALPDALPKLLERHFLQAKASSRDICLDNNNAKLAKLADAKSNTKYGSSKHGFIAPQDDQNDRDQYVGGNELVGQLASNQHGIVARLDDTGGFDDAGGYRGDEFDAYAMMAPQYAYGRHRGPSPKQTHRAAVLIALLRDDQGRWFVPLTLRPTQMQDHAGQVSLPGGRAEKREDAITTAYREFEEELGWSSNHLSYLGNLKPIYVYASRHRVTPIVAYSETMPQFKPNSSEVAELISLSIEDLLGPSVIDVGILQRGTMQFKAPGYWIGGHFVWGATAMILTEFRERLLSVLSGE